MAVCAVGLALAAVAVQRGLSLADSYIAVVVGAFAIGAAAVLIGAARSRSASEGFGAANQVTLFRGAMTASAFGLVVAEPSTAVLWTAVAAAGGALLLDGVDGALARRGGTASAFGARFDMETDALSILVLAVLALHFGRAGAWVLLSGLLRYAFVAAGFLLPWMRADLPQSRRRQTVCVVQIVSLVICLAPVVPQTLGSAAAALGLAALAASFAVDVAWLARHARRQDGAAGVQGGSRPEAPLLKASSIR